MKEKYAIKDANKLIAELETRFTNLSAEVATARAETATVSETLLELQSERFTLFRANLLTALVKKLCIDTKKTSPDSTSGADEGGGHKVTRWASLAGSFEKEEVKKATQHFNISKQSDLIMKALGRYSEVSLKPRVLGMDSSVC